MPWFDLWTNEQVDSSRVCCSQGSNTDIGEKYMYVEKLEWVDIYV